MGGATSATWWLVELDSQTFGVAESLVRPSRQLFVGGVFPDSACRNQRRPQLEEILGAVPDLSDGRKRGGHRLLTRNRDRLR